MADSYDDKINAMLSKRERIAAQRRAQRQQELRKQYAILAGGIIVLIVIVVLLVKGCSPDKEKDVPKTTTSASVKKDNNKKDNKEKVTKEENTTSQESTEGQAEETTEETTEENTTEAGTGEKLYTTDVLNFRTNPSTDADLIIHIDKGEQVEVVAVEGEWCKVNYDMYTGYVKYEYLSKKKPK